MHDTGKIIGQFYRDLIANGIPDEMAHAITVNAAKDYIAKYDLAVTFDALAVSA